MQHYSLHVDELTCVLLFACLDVSCMLEVGLNFVRQAVMFVSHCFLATTAQVIVDLCILLLCTRQVQRLDEEVRRYAAESVPPAVLQCVSTAHSL
jgi:hypothetical protein